MRKMEHIHYPASAPVGHSQIPAIVRPTVVQPVSITILSMSLSYQPRSKEKSSPDNSPEASHRETEQAQSPT